MDAALNWMSAPCDWKTIEVLPEAMVRGEDGVLRLTVPVPRSLEDWRVHVVFTRPGCAVPEPKG